jgi:hypothetical protein
MLLEKHDYIMIAAIWFPLWWESLVVHFFVTIWMIDKSVRFGSVQFLRFKFRFGLISQKLQPIPTLVQAVICGAQSHGYRTIFFRVPRHPFALYWLVRSSLVIQRRSKSYLPVPFSSLVTTAWGWIEVNDRYYTTLLFSYLELQFSDNEFSPLLHVCI